MGGQDVGLGVNIRNAEPLPLVFAVVMFAARKAGYVCGNQIVPGRGHGCGAAVVELAVVVRVRLLASINTIRALASAVAVQNLCSGELRRAGRRSGRLGGTGGADGVGDGRPSTVGGRDIRLSVNVRDSEEVSLVYAELVDAAREAGYVCGNQIVPGRGHGFGVASVELAVVVRVLLLASINTIRALARTITVENLCSGELRRTGRIVTGGADGVGDGRPSTVGGRDVGLSVNIRDAEEISVVFAHIEFAAREAGYVCGNRIVPGRGH